MNLVICLALLCFVLVGSVFAADCNDASTPCVQTCTTAQCTFDCGNSKECKQICAKQACAGMECSVNDKCEQFCLQCKNRMICSSPICVQSCVGPYCDMECTPKVKECFQTCRSGSVCKVSCDMDKTKCNLGCDGANCTGDAVPPLPPKKVSSCDELTGICTKSCFGAKCKETTLSCGDGKYKDCTLLCDNGCKMECDSSVQKCNQTCIGDTSCTSVCDAHSCLRVGKFASSAMVCQINYLLLALCACVMLFQVKNV